MFWQQKLISEKEEAGKLQVKDMQNKIEKILENTRVPLPTKEYRDRIDAKISKLETDLATVRATGKTNLKTRATLLSNQIMKFVLDRERSAPPIPREGSWYEDVDKIMKYSSESVNLFYLNFQPKVAAIHDELVEHGLQDDEFDKFYRHPVNYLVMQLVAERIAVLAEKLH